jgi:heptosyltransferase-3
MKRSRFDSQLSFDPNDIKKILLIQLGDIGDVVLTFPLIAKLNQRFSPAELVVAVREKTAELVEESGIAKEVISVDKKKRGIIGGIKHQKNFFKHLRKQRFDLAIDLRHGTRGAILAFLSGAPERIAFYTAKETFWRNRLFTRLAPITYSREMYFGEYLMSLLEYFSLADGPFRLEISVSENTKTRAEELFTRENIPAGKPLVAIQPFSLWPHKEWSAEKFARLADRIDSVFGYPVLLIGSKDEAERAAEIAGQSRAKIYNLAGKTPLGLLPAVFAMCSFFIGIDSAGLHIAAAAKVPTAGIFGPSLFTSWAPRGKNHRLIAKDWPCVPCDRKGCEGSEVSRCLDQLTVEETWRMVKEHMESTIGENATTQT